jgi:hypothetical protein
MFEDALNQLKKEGCCGFSPYKVYEYSDASAGLGSHKFSVYKTEYQQRINRAIAERALSGEILITTFEFTGD